MARFDLLSYVYDWLPIPTHGDRLRKRLADESGPRLDLGGGTGKFSVQIHEGHYPVILDSSPGMLERGREADRRVAGVRGLGQAMPFEADTFGAVTVTEAFHHFTGHQRDVLAEIARVLDPEGVFLVEEIDPNRFLGRAVELTENLAMRFGSNFRTPEELAALVADCFDDVAVTRTGMFTYVVEAREPDAAGANGQKTDPEP